MVMTASSGDTLCHYTDTMRFRTLLQHCQNKKQRLKSKVHITRNPRGKAEEQPVNVLRNVCLKRIFPLKHWNQDTTSSPSKHYYSEESTAFNKKQLSAPRTATFQCTQTHQQQSQDTHSDTAPASFNNISINTQHFSNYPTKARHHYVNKTTKRIPLGG